MWQGYGRAVYVWRKPFPTTVLGVPAPTGPTRSGLLSSGPLTVLARPWPNDPDRAYLLITGGHSDSVGPPERATVNEWLHTLAMWGYRSVRTGALNSGLASGLSAVGFSTVQDLVLMSTDLSGHLRSPSEPGPGRVRQLRAWPRPSRAALDQILGIDQQSFGTAWAMDADTFAEARAATGRARIVVSEVERRTVGFVLAGATGRDGYIQRLAVLPDARRAGHAARLLDHAHDWLRRAGCSVAYVNTERTNDAAMTLYLRAGYAALPYGLQVLERSLTHGGNP